jgi:hypothetical protein
LSAIQEVLLCREIFSPSLKRWDCRGIWDLGSANKLLKFLIIIITLIHSDVRAGELPVVSDEVLRIIAGL